MLLLKRSWLLRFFRRTVACHPGGKYAFVGIPSGFLPDTTICLHGRLFVAAAHVEHVLQAYRTVHEKEPVDLTERCGFFTATSCDQLIRALANKVNKPWLFWRVLEPGELVQTPPGFIRAEGDRDGLCEVVAVVSALAVVCAR